MNPLGLGYEDREEFEKACTAMGSLAPGILARRIGDEVFEFEMSRCHKDVRDFLSLMDADWMRSAGRAEFAWWFSLLPSAKRNSLGRSLLAIVSGVKKPSALRMHKCSMASFQNALHTPMGSGLDVVSMAAAHHGARCLADCAPGRLHSLLLGLNPSWVHTLLLFHGDVVDCQGCRQAARGMRNHWLKEVG